MFSIRGISIGLVIGLIVGGVIAYSATFYAVSLPRFRSYEDQIEGLQSLIFDLDENKTQLEEQILELEEDLESSSSAYSSLENLYRDVQTKYSEVEPTIQALNSSYQSLREDYDLLKNSSLTLEAEFNASIEEINERHTALLNTLEIYELYNFTQTVDYTLSDGEVKTFTFEIPYGILWDVELIHEFNRITTTVSWRRGETRGFKGVNTHFLPVQHMDVTGTITVDYYDQGTNLNVISVITADYQGTLETHHQNFKK